LGIYEGLIWGRDFTVSIYYTESNICTLNN
jgi:hypothetical protein